MPSRSLSYAKIIQLLLNTKLKEVKPTYLVLTKQKSLCKNTRFPANSNDNLGKNDRFGAKLYTRNFPPRRGEGNPTLGGSIPHAVGEILTYVIRYGVSIIF